MEGAVIGGLVAQEEGKLIEIVRGKGIHLQAKRAVGKPVVFGHVMHQQFFGGVGGRVIGNQRLMESGKFGGVFVGQEKGAGSETVFERIAAGSSFAGWGAGAGGMERSE